MLRNKVTKKRMGIIIKGDRKSGEVHYGKIFESGQYYIQKSN